MSMTEKAMQNRFLSRGKRLDNGEFVTGYYRIDKQGNHTIYPNDYSLHQNRKDFLVEAFYIDPVTIGQCTGLFAEKSYRGESEADRLIFEGDILTCSELERMCLCADDLPYAVVEWSKIKACWRGDIPTACYEMQASSFSNAEIIGNIHDNIKAEDE